MSHAPSRRIVIIGGVASGSSCATRARRLNEDCEIIVLEKGPHVSFANCGLPYHVSGVIEDEQSLLLVSPERFRERFNIDVRTHSEATRIDRVARTVHVTSHATGEQYELPYDSLLLAPGASTFVPAAPGVDLPGVFTLRTVPDTRRVKQWIADKGAKTAVVVGAGFIGLELAENLHHLGLNVHVVEMAPQVLPSIDAEIAAPVAQTLRDHGIALHLGQRMNAIEAKHDALTIVTSEARITGDIVILGLGVRPRTKLATDAGLEVGRLGGIVVDAQMRTSDPDIYAAGDVTEEMCAITGLQTTMPLAGPANRQGRAAADAMIGRQVRFRGVQGTAVCGLFGTTVATTGLTEARAKQTAGLKYQVARLHPSNHVSYYPGASTIALKVIYDAMDGRVLGASAFGTEGVDKRIDVLAMAIHLGGSVYDLEQAELCYAPQFGAAKDPVNLAGMIASNALRGDMPSATWDDVNDKTVLVDVRERDEWDEAHVSGALNLPLSELRTHLDKLPMDRDIIVYCKSGKRSYDAVRALIQHGFTARTISGGLLSRL